MSSICLYFKVHQPYRLKKYESHEVDVFHCYSDPAADADAIDEVAENCYLPANAVIRRLIEKHRHRFRISFSISGTIIELLQKYRPDVLQSFIELTATGNVEILGETYHNSFSSLYSKKEFIRQVIKHREAVKAVFKQTPIVFRNTALIHNDQVVTMVAQMGFRGMLCEGVSRILQGRSVNRVYGVRSTNEVSILLRNATLSDDIAFRFDDPGWKEHPLTADKFANWLHSHPADAEVFNLFIDYETFGIHKKQDTGVFDLLEVLPGATFEKDGYVFSAPSEILDAIDPSGYYDSPQTISWDDRLAAPCIGTDNVMQHNALRKIYSLENLVMQGNCERSLDKWGHLQAADHFCYMASNDQWIGKYINPFGTAEEAFRNYANIVADFEISLIRKELLHVKKFSALKHASFHFF